MKKKIIDCRSKKGVTIGLVDSLITISRILAKRDLDDYDIIEALRDLRGDEDFNFIVSQYQLAVGNNS